MLRAQVLQDCASALDSLQQSLRDKVIPADCELPSVAEWLRRHGLSDFEFTLSDWDLRILIEMANEMGGKEFDDEFKEELESRPKRRKLYQCLKDEFAMRAK